MTAMTAEEAVAHILANEPAFAVADTQVRGVTFRAFQNVPKTVHALLPAGWEKHGQGALEYLVYEDDRLTYAQFAENVHRLAHAMQDDLGLGKGDRIAIAMRNYPELLTLVLAISSIGATVVFVNAWPPRPACIRLPSSIPARPGSPSIWATRWACMPARW
ncbi:MAG: AMP-binding protein, partial [Sulfitobacter sp.]|nr:AMP-binding protein [Sulfitobacter sp.]